jgi:hypothetical protein
MTTTSPSRVTRTSSSSPPAPASDASWKASSVFSGASAEAPRWAKPVGQGPLLAVRFSRRKRETATRAPERPATAAIRMRLISTSAT